MGPIETTYRSNLLRFAETQVHYPLENRLQLSSEDSLILEAISNGSNKDTLDLRNCQHQGKQPLWRLAAIYQLCQLIFTADTTVVLMADTKHLARKAYQTLLFPLNRLSSEHQPEVLVKTSDTILFANGSEVKIYAPGMNRPVIRNKRVLMFAHIIEPAFFKQEKTVCLGAVGVA